MQNENVFCYMQKSWLVMTKQLNTSLATVYKERFIFYYIDNQNFLEMLWFCSCFGAVLCKSIWYWLLAGEYYCITVVDTNELL